MSSNSSLVNKVGATEQLIHNQLEEQGSLHLTLIDPDEQSPPQAAKMSRIAAEAGTDGIMVGGSVLSNSAMEDTVKAIKNELDETDRKSDTPVIIFPGNVEQVVPEADCLFYMSLVNSEDPYWITKAQMLSAYPLFKSELETIPLAYIIIEPGGAAGYVGDAKPIKRNNGKIAAAYALSAQMMGKRLVYLEAGSGAEAPVPASMIKKTSHLLQVPLIVGGGIRSKQEARKAVQAGADVVVTGTVVESLSQQEQGRQQLENIISGVKAGNR